MGTRHLTAVISGNQPKIAQYGQWDGYPEGQGKTVLSFLQNCIQNERLNQFKAKINSLTWLTDEQSEAIDKDPNWTKNYPHLSRDTGADILQMVLDKEIDGLTNSYDFAADSLFCEWAYIIDLDKNSFEVYKGFNKTPLAETERFFSMQEGREEKAYYPVKLVKAFEITNLPSKEQFLKEAEPQEEEEEEDTF